MRVDKHGTISEGSKPVCTYADCLGISVDSKHDTAWQARTQQFTSMPTIPHRTVQIDAARLGSEPKHNLGTHNRRVTKSRFIFILPSFTHNLPRHGGVYSTDIHCQ